MTSLLDRSLQQGQESYDGEVDGGDIGVVGFAPFFKAFVVPELVLELFSIFVLGLCFGSRDTGGSHYCFKLDMFAMME